MARRGTEAAEMAAIVNVALSSMAFAIQPRIRPILEAVYRRGFDAGRITGIRECKAIVMRQVRKGKRHAR